MITKRKWLESSGPATWYVEGYFLFGLIPLYVRDVSARPSRITRPRGAR
jgi:hypothetical protein